MSEQFSIRLSADGESLEGTFKVSAAYAKRLAAELGGVSEQSDQAAKATRTLGDETEKTTRRKRGMLGALTSLRGMLATLGLTAAAAAVVNFGDRIDKTSIRIGASTQALSEYSLVARRTGVQFETLTNSWQRQTRAIAEAVQGQGAAREALDELGLSARDLAALRPEDQFERISQAMQGVSDQGDRVRLAMRLWGNAGTELLQIVDAGTESIAGMREEARRFGLSMSRDQAAALASLGDAAGDTRAILEGMALQLVSALAPAVTALVTAANELLLKLRQVIQVVIDWVQWIWNVLAAIEPLRTAIVVVADNLDVAAVAVVAFAGVKGLGLIVAMAPTTAGALGVVTAAATALRTVLLTLAGPAGLIAIAAAAVYGFSRAQMQNVSAADTLRAALTELANAKDEDIRVSYEAAKQARSMAAERLREATAALAVAQAELELQRQRAQARPVNWLRVGSITPQSQAADEVRRIEGLIATLTELQAKADQQLAEGGEAHTRYRRSLQETTRVIPPLITVTQSQSAALEQLLALQRAMAGETGDAYVQAALAYQARMEALHEIQLELVASGMAESRAVEMVASARREAAAIYQRQTEALAAQLSPVQQILADLDEEVRLLGMSAEARQVEILLRQVEQEMIARGQPLTAAALDQLREEIALRVQKIETLKAETADTVESVRIQTEGWDRMHNALIDALAGGKRGFRAFAEQLKLEAKRLVASILLQFAQLRGLGGLLGGLGGGGVSAFGATGSPGVSAGMPGMDLFAGGAALPGLGALGGALYGFRQRGGGGASSVAAGLAYGGLGWTAGTIGYGAMLGGAAGAATGVSGAAASGALSGGLGAAGAIPVIGWIAAIAALVDMISGGKLFGSRYRPESAEAGLQFGPGGASAYAQTVDVRQRSLFRGRQWRTSSLDPGDDARAAAAEAWTLIQSTMTAGARALGVEVPPVISATMKRITEFDKKGRETSSREVVEILGKIYEEDAQTAIKRVLGENLLRVVDASLGDAGSFAATYAERWRKSADDLLAGAQTLLRIQADIVTGLGLLGAEGGLPEVLGLLDALAQDGESLGDTYDRLSVASRAFRDALMLSGLEAKASAAEIVTFAAALADAAGGADEVARLFGVYAEGFLDPVERLALGFQRLSADAVAATAALGFEGLPTREAFRAAFEAAMPDLSPEDWVQWLRAGEALDALLRAGEPLSAFLQDIAADMAELAGGAFDYAGAIDAVIAQTQAQLTWAAALGASEEELTQIRAFGVAQVEALAQAQAEAAEAYRRHMQDIVLGIEGVDPTGFRRRMLEITRATEQAEVDAHALARAAGLQGAAERDLALIHRWAASQVRAAIAALRQDTQSLIEQLYGTPLSRLEAQIAELQNQQQQTWSSIGEGVGGVGQAVREVLSQWQGGLQRIASYLDSLLVGSLSPLTPGEQILEAERQFFDAIARAGAGDLEALQALPQLADVLLRLGQSHFASGPGYTDLFTRVTEALRGMLTLPDPGTTDYAGAMASAGGWAVGGEVEYTSPELEALLAERDARLAQQEAAQRLILATQLADYLRELAAALGVPVLDLAEQLGVSIEAFVRDLGIVVSDATSETVRQLAGVAALLGVELAELAQAVGVELGRLSDQQSLVSQALAETIEALGPDVTDVLGPLLQAVWDATTEADANAALAALEAATLDLPDEYRNALAPYLEGVSPVLVEVLDELDWLGEIAAKATAQIEVLEAVRSSTRSIELQTIEVAAAAADVVSALDVANDTLGSIRNLLRASNDAQGYPASFLTGSAGLPRDGLIMAHAGEKVIDPTSSSILERYGIRVRGEGGGQDSAALLAELRALRRAVEGSDEQTRASFGQRLERLERAVQDGFERQRQALDRNTDALLQGRRVA